jgi:hypothetical protein
MRLRQAQSYLLVSHDNQLYLSLEHIDNDKEREYFYRLIQRYQTGQEVNLSTLPPEFQRLLQPGLQPQANFWGPLIIGGVVGLVVGVTAMALSMLILNIMSVTLNNSAVAAFNLQVPTIIFVIFSALGWFVAFWAARSRLKPLE